MTDRPPSGQQLDDDGNPLPATALEDRQRRRGFSPDLHPDPSNDTDVDAAVRARRNRKVTR